MSGTSHLQIKDSDVISSIKYNYANITVSPNTPNIVSQTPIKNNKISRTSSTTNSPKSTNTKKITYRCPDYFSNGICLLGKKCNLSHEYPPKFKTNLCTYFTTTGKCAQGEMCNFIHIDKISNPSNRKNSSSSIESSISEENISECENLSDKTILHMSNSFPKNKTAENKPHIVTCFQALDSAGYSNTDMGISVGVSIQIPHKCLFRALPETTFSPGTPLEETCPHPQQTFSRFSNEPLKKNNDQKKNSDKQIQQTYSDNYKKTDIDFCLNQMLRNFRKSMAENIIN